MCAGLTGNNSWDAPANGVVEPDVAVVDVPQFCQHAVDVQPLHEHPGKGAHVEVVEEDGNHCTHKLEGEKREGRGRGQWTRNPQTTKNVHSTYLISRLSE